MSSESTLISATNSGANEFLKLIEQRRTIYHLTSALPPSVSDDRIVQIVQHVLRHTPSSFNSQSSRAVVLFSSAHQWLWDTVLSVLRPIVPASEFPRTEKKVNEYFKAAHGTILFFEDNKDVKDLQERWPRYQDRFPTWSQHTSGMAQFAVWTALTAEGVSASLQHYNPLIDEKVREHFDLPITWSLIAQMPFGLAAGPAEEKTFKPVETMVKVFRE